MGFWNASTGSFSVVGSGSTEVGGQQDGTVAWCNNPCSALHLSRADGSDREIAAPDDTSFSIYSLKFSADGRTLAVVLNPPGQLTPTVPSHVAIIDTAAGTLHQVATRTSVTAQLGWSPDGEQLFVLSNSGQGVLRLGRLVGPAGPFEMVELPIEAPINQFVAVEPGRAPGFVESAPTSAEPCPPTPQQPNEQKPSLCTMRY